MNEDEKTRIAYKKKVKKITITMVIIGIVIVWFFIAINNICKSGC